MGSPVLEELKNGLNKQLLGMILTQIYLPDGRKMDLASSVPFPCSLVQ